MTNCCTRRPRCQDVWCFNIDAPEGRWLIRADKLWVYDHTDEVFEGGDFHQAVIVDFEQLVIAHSSSLVWRARRNRNYYKHC